DERLSDLLVTWEEHFERGEDIPAERLSRDCPGLAPALATRILALKKFAWMNVPVGDAEDLANVGPASGASLTAQGEQARPPTMGAGRYRLDGLIAEGGFARVWRGLDTELQRLVAVKVPRRRRLADQANVQGFLAEARKVARLNHVGIVPVYDVGRHGDSYF